MFNTKKNESKNTRMETIKTFIHSKNGDATLNWILGVVISVGIVAGLIALVTPSLSTIWTSVMAKITAVLS